MSTSRPANPVQIEAASHKRQLSYDEYALHYDRLCDLLPVYQDNIGSLLDILPKLNLPDDARICDLGAGTGNYILALSDVLPDANYVHVDMNSNMNNLAKQKYELAGVRNVQMVEEFIERAEFPDEHFDLVICVNALNTASPQLPVLRKMSKWLKPNASLFLIDFGRKQRVLDWGWYIFSSAIKAGNLNSYLKALMKNREFIKQNRLAAKDQSNGVMWTHTLEEFSDLVGKAGFSIEESATCYRGYCDLVLARKSEGAHLVFSIEEHSHT